jgi:hypothetical protein
MTLHLAAMYDCSDIAALLLERRLVDENSQDKVRYCIRLLCLVSV